MLSSFYPLYPWSVHWALIFHLLGRLLLRSSDPYFIQNVLQVQKPQGPTILSVLPKKFFLEGFSRDHMGKAQKPCDLQKSFWLMRPGFLLIAFLFSDKPFKIHRRKYLEWQYQKKIEHWPGNIFQIILNIEACANISKSYMTCKIDHSNNFWFWKSCFWCSRAMVVIRHLTLQ